MSTRIWHPCNVWSWRLSIIVSVIATLSASNLSMAQNLDSPIIIVEPSDTLSYAVALERSLQNNPQLKAASFEQQSAEWLRREAGKIQDPRLDLEFEDLGSSGVQQPVLTVVMNQRIELGGKRAARKRLSGSQLSLAKIRNGLTEQHVTRLVKVRYAEAVAAQTRAQAEWSNLELSRTTTQVIEQQVEAGERAALDLTRSEIATVEAETQFGRSELAKRSTLSNLVALWGGHLDFDSVEESLILAPIPDLNILEAQLSNSALLSESKSETRLFKNRFDIEKSKRVPDLVIGAGYRYFEANSDHAAIGKLSIVIPLFNGNRSSTKSAFFQLNRAEAEQDAANLDAHIRLSEVHSELAMYHLTAIGLRDKIMPRAAEVVQLTIVGYEEGKFSILDVLEAQKILATSRARLNDTLLQYQYAISELERLTDPAIRLSE